MSDSDHHSIEPTELNSIPVVVYVLLRDGWYGPESLYITILDRIREIIGGMQPEVLYTLEDLVGTDYWRTLSIGERRTGGRCVPDMIVRGLLPDIEIGECKRTRRLRYRLILN